MFIELMNSLKGINVWAISEFQLWSITITVINIADQWVVGVTTEGKNIMAPFLYIRDTQEKAYELLLELISEEKDRLTDASISISGSSGM